MVRILAVGHRLSSPRNGKLPLGGREVNNAGKRKGLAGYMEKNGSERAPGGGWRRQRFS